MREITDGQLLDKYIEKNHITQHLKDQGLIFRLFQYEDGEMLSNMTDKIKYVQFVVKGAIEIYSIRNDGTSYTVRHVNEFTILGDVELCENRPSSLFVEAKSRVFCLALSFNEYSEMLLDDNEFLRFVIRSLSQKLVLFSESESRFKTFEERFIHYITEECEDNMITSVEKTTFQMRCSRRQLQRVLKKLVEDKVIIKLGRGIYKLNK